MAVNAEYLELVVGNVLEFGDNISKLTADRLAFDLKEVFSDAESFAWTLGFAKNAIAKAYYEGSISAANVTYLSDTVCDAATKFTISWIEKNTPSHRQLVFDVCYLQLMIAEASARAQASKISSESNSVSASNGETASDNKAFLIPVHAAFAKKFANPYKRVVEQCLQEKDIVTFGKIAAASSVCDTITPLFKEVVEERGQYISYYSVDKNHLTLFFDQAANTITMHAETNANRHR